MTWWNIVPNSNCVFALDSNSVITSDKVYFSNKPTRYLSFYNGKNNSGIGTTSGSDMYNGDSEVKIYKSLNINRSNLIFDTPVTLPVEFTIILKCRVISSTNFLSNTSLEYVLAYGVGDYTTQTTDGFWMMRNYTSGGTIPRTEAIKYTKDLQTVILKGSSAAKDVTLKTNLGLFTVPPASTAYSTSLRSKDHNNMGDSGTAATWRTDSEIIAYGLFDKILSDSEVNTILESIESEFKLRTTSITFKNKPTEHVVYSTIVEKPKDFNNINFKSSLSIKPNMVPGHLGSDFNLGDIKTINTLYSKVKTLEDKVLKEGEPTQTKLFLYEKGQGLLIKTTISDKEGNFKFIDLDPNLEYIVRASDYKYQFKSILKDYNKD